MVTQILANFTNFTNFFCVILQKEIRVKFDYVFPKISRNRFKAS